MPTSGQGGISPDASKFRESVLSCPALLCPVTKLDKSGIAIAIPREIVRPRQQVEIPRERSRYLVAGLVSRHGVLHFEPHRVDDFVEHVVLHSSLLP